MDLEVFPGQLLSVRLRLRTGFFVVLLAAVLLHTVWDSFTNEGKVGRIADVVFGLIALCPPVTVVPHSWLSGFFTWLFV